MVMYFKHDYYGNPRKVSKNYNFMEKRIFIKNMLTIYFYRKHYLPFMCYFAKDCLPGSQPITTSLLAYKPCN